MQVNTLLEQMLFTTVRITTVNPDGSMGLGTGFVYQQDMPTGKVANALVTNKHVVAGASQVTLHFIEAKDAQTPLLGRAIVYTVENPGTAFTGHPDPDIDVAILPLGGIIQVVKDSGKDIFFRSVGPSIMATPELLDVYEPIEPVIFVGYPNGLYDSTSLLPIVRRGHSATALNVDYEDKPMFLIDASVFPGSSGSPVFLLSASSEPDKHGNVVIGGAPKFLFLGVIAAVYERDVPVLTGGGSLQPFVWDSLDIGLVYKATTVRDLLDMMLALSDQPGA